LVGTGTGGETVTDGRGSGSGGRGEWVGSPVGALEGDGNDSPDVSVGDTDRDGGADCDGGDDRSGDLASPGAESDEMEGVEGDSQSWACR
jgi:hypothetical protein